MVDEKKPQAGADMEGEKVDPERRLPAGSENVETTKDAREKPPEPDPAPSRRVGGGGIAAVALIIALLAAGVAGYQVWRDQREAERATETPDWNRRIDERVTQARSEIDQSVSRLEESVADLSASVPELASEIDERLDALSRDIGKAQARADSAAGATQRIEQTLREQIAALERRFEVAEKNMSRLASQAGDEDDRLLLAEAEFLMRLAGERLTLFEDPGSATEALRMALGHLRAVDDPLYGSVRETLATEIERLAEFEAPNRAEISGQLLHLADASSGWPVDQRRTVDKAGTNVLAPDTDEEGWWARAREVISGVVNIHQESGDAPAILTLQEQRLLRENVRLQLQLAQLAAIRGEATLYGNALSTVEDWIRGYYAVESESVATALDRIRALRSADVAPELPTIGQALRELRALRASADMAEDAS